MGMRGPPWMRGRPDMFGNRGMQGMPGAWPDETSQAPGTDTQPGTDTSGGVPGSDTPQFAPDDAEIAQAAAGQGGPAAPTPQRFPGTGIRSQVANTLSNAGLSDNAIAGIMQNIGDESGGRPGLIGDRGQSAGLYQFNRGGQWPNYARWLRQHGRSDWQNPALQTRFVADWLKANNPRAWAAMNAARTPGEAANIFLRAFENPAPYYLASRSSRYMHGVPDLASWVR
jgi:hypothetical protein